MATPEEISLLRAEVIDKSINIEWLINSIISQHFFGKPRIDFVSLVLYDEYCSFALKRRVLIKIKPELAGKTEHAINRLNTIRNYFAHVGQGFIDGPDPNGPSRVPDPRDFSKSVDFAAMSTEFNALEAGLNNQLFSLFKEMGGEVAA